MPPEQATSTGADQHFRALESLYASAPVNDLFASQLEIIGEGHSRITFEVDERSFHAAGAAHGTIYFKMLDDAAFFAANSLEPDYFVLTTSFTTYMTRPISTGKMRAVGKVVNQNRSQLIAEAVVYDDDGNEVGRGNGIFMRSKMLLAQTPGYKDYLESST